MTDVRAILEGLSPDAKAAFQKFVGSKGPTVAAQPVAPPIAPPSLGPQQQVAFDQALSSSNTAYGNQLTQNNYQRGQAQQGFGDQRSNLMLQYQRLRAAAPYSANRRGLLRSGIYKNQLAQGAGDQARTLGQFDRNAQGQLGQFDLLAQQYASQRQDAQSGIAAQRQAALAQLALQLGGQ